jgi:L-arabinose isomerase
MRLSKKEVWFITGSQQLYGDEILKRVAEDSATIAGYLDKSEELITRVLFKPVLTSSESIYNIVIEANSSPDCIGLITWMHTFSPAKMWIRGLDILNKPFVHFHTQFNRDIPWGEIDMDFMNLNQSAHGGREFGFIGSRMRIDRKVITGYWQDKDAIKSLGIWVRAALAYDDSKTMKIARFGDNMREVAVTEGNKVSAQIKMGYSVYGFGVSDLVKVVNKVSDSEIEKLLLEYKDSYKMSASPIYMDTVREAARIEIGMERFLEDGDFKAFTTTFEDLSGLRQLPGLAVQRLMNKGYGFGAEGDWKTAALVRSLKVMGEGLEGGTSFMEDYTYHLDPSGMRVLGAHMLEICPSIAGGKPSLEAHPLGIGGKEDPARLVFNAKPGNGLNVSVLDMGNRFRMLVNKVEVLEYPQMPKLPVAGVLWKPLPNLKIAATAWILAGGSHHTAFSKAITTEYLEDFALMSGIEYLLIDDNCYINDFKKEIRWNELYYHLAKGI